MTVETDEYGKALAKQWALNNHGMGIDHTARAYYMGWCSRGGFEKSNPKEHVTIAEHAHELAKRDEETTKWKDEYENVCKFATDYENRLQEKCEALRDALKANQESAWIVAAKDLEIERLRTALERIDKFTIDPKDKLLDPDFASPGHRRVIKDTISAALRKP